MVFAALVKCVTSTEEKIVNRNNQYTYDTNSVYDCINLQEECNLFLKKLEEISTDKLFNMQNTRHDVSDTRSDETRIM